MSKLREWRKARGLTQAQAAELIRVTAVAFGRYENGRVPDPAVMQRIIEATDGNVTPNDWYEMPQAHRAQAGAAA